MFMNPTGSQETFVSLKIENEQIKKDNAFLIDLLKSTKKYAKLASYIRDSGGHASKMESLSPPRLPTAHRRCYQGLIDKKKIEDAFASDGFEDELIPTEAFQLANKFRSQHGNDLS